MTSMTAPIDYMPSLAKAGEAHGGGGSGHVGRLHALFTADITGPGGAKNRRKKGQINCPTPCKSKKWAARLLIEWPL